jgi:WD40 repeat protein
VVLATTGNDRLDLIEPLSGKVVRSLRTNQPASAATLSPDGTRLAAKCGHDLIVWDLGAGTQRNLGAAPTNGFPFRFTPEGSTLAVALADGRVRIIDLRSWQSHFLQGMESRPGTVHLGLEWSPDGNQLAVSGHQNGGIVIPLGVWRLADGQRIATVRGRDPTNEICFARDGRSVLSASGRSLRRWHLSPPPERDSISHPPEAWALAFTRDGRTLASAGDDNRIRLWDAETADPRGQLAGHEATVSALAFHPGGRLLASASLGDRNNLTLWDMDQARETVRLKGHGQRIRALAFSPDGAILASGSWDRTIRLWDPITRTCLRTLSGHTDRVRDVAFTPDGRTLASAGEDRQIRLWDVATGATLRVLPCRHEATSVTFSPDGSTLAWTDFEGRLTAWDMDRDVPRFTQSLEDGELTEVTYSPDGTILATGGKSGTVRLWDLRSGQELLSFKCKGRVNGLTFSPDGSVLAACDLAGEISFWRTSDSSR